MDLTGAQIKAALEQQWQPAGARRGRSCGSGVEGLHLHLRRHQRPAGLADHGHVARRRRRSTGGDVLGHGELVPRHRRRQLPALAGGTDKHDTGKTDLQAMVDYMAEFANTGAGDPPLPVDYSQRAVGVQFPAARRRVRRR